MKQKPRPVYCAHPEPEGLPCYERATKKYCTNLTRCKYFMKEKENEKKD